MVSSALFCSFVRSLAGLRKSTRLIFTNFYRKVAHGPWKKRFHFGGNPDHVTLGLGLYDTGYSAWEEMC